MENQHRKIVGYRELSQEEIDLMNEIKMAGALLQELFMKVEIFDANSGSAAGINESARWRAIAKTHLQQGLMALTRAVAKPDFF